MRVAIIGCGFAGIGMGIKLRQAGVRDFVIFEKSHDVGGTWRDNTYPGAACDIPSLLYSFSFEPKADWSRRFPPQEEILDYLRHCVRKYGLAPHIRFGTEVVAARFDEAAPAWRITTRRSPDGRPEHLGGDPGPAEGTETADVLISACGQLNRPAYPELTGLQEFAGVVFHSARWNHDHDLAGRQVAVLGTGASAIQFVPHVASLARRLSVFQRSAPYVIGKHDRPYRPWERAALRYVPGARALSRARQYLQYEARVLGFIRYRGLMELLAKRFRANLVTQVPDRELRRALIPDYPMGCKRILLSSDYYAALCRENVELVTEPISEVRPRALVTADGREHPADTIIFGTGFRATEFLSPMRIVGRGGRELGEVWRDGAEAYLGITVAGFPNLFLLYGPNTNLGHNSIIYMLESQIRYVVKAVRALRRSDVEFLDVRPEAQRAFNARLQRRFGETVWDQGCTSWYKNAFGKITNNWPSYTFAYRLATRRPRLADYVVRRGAQA